MLIILWSTAHADTQTHQQSQTYTQMDRQTTPNKVIWIAVFTPVAANVYNNNVKRRGDP